MLTTVFTLNNADFSGKGFPNLFPYIRKENLEVAYDFSKREGALKSLVNPDQMFASPYTLEVDEIGATSEWVPAPVLYSADEKGIQHIDDRLVRLVGLDFFTRNDNKWYPRETDFTLLMKINVQSHTKTNSVYILDIHNHTAGNNGFTLGVSSSSGGYRIDMRIEHISVNLQDDTVLPFNKEVCVVIKNTGGVISIELPEYDVITGKDISELDLRYVDYIGMPKTRPPSIGAANSSTIGRTGINFSTLGFALWNVSLSTSELKEQIAMLNS